MNDLYNLVRVTTATIGTGTVTLGAAVAGWLTFAEAGVPSGAVLTCCFIDGLQKEIGRCTYTSAGLTLTRDSVYRSTGAANVGLITLSGSATVIITPAAEDFTAITLGSTAIELGNTVATVTGLTLSGGTLSGITTLPGSGQITASGELALGGTPVALLTLVGTYTTANAANVRITNNFASSSTTTQYGEWVGPTFAPSGASLTTLLGFQVLPTLNSTSFTIATVAANRADFTIGASFTGTITNFYNYQAMDVTPGGGTITNLTQFLGTAATNGNGLTTGTVTNRQFSALGVTAGAAGGTVNNRGLNIIVPSGTAPASGTVNNDGILITGNGGAAPGGSGVVANFAFRSTSTAAVQVGGLLQFLGATSSFPAFKRSTTTIQARLADDSGDAALSASQLTSTIATGTAPLVVASTTVVANLNASSLGGATFAAPGAIGGTTPGIVNATYVQPGVGNALTAVGSTRADALQLAKQINNVTVAATGTGVILPVGVIGMYIDVFAGPAMAAASIKVYASGSETIDTVAGSTGVVLTKAKRCRYYFVAANTWISAQWGVISA